MTYQLLDSFVPSITVTPPRDRGMITVVEPSAQW